MAKGASTVAMALCITLLGGCGRVWLPGTGPLTPHPPPPVPAAEALEPMLRDCIAQHDPDRLASFHSVSDYPMSGLLASERIAPVRHCMEAKGWLDSPTWSGP